MTSRSGPPFVASPQPRREIQRRGVRIPPLGLPGILGEPEDARCIVIFAHGSGSSRLSPRNNAVAQALNGEGMATLLFDLLTPGEEEDRANVFDIALLASRLANAVDWVAQMASPGHGAIGLFGASTGAAAALVAASNMPAMIGAVVSRGGRPDLAGEALARVRAPTLLIVGGADFGVIELNESAYRQMTCVKALEIVPGATHLFPEPGALETAIGHAARWFRRYLVPRGKTWEKGDGHAV